MPADTPTDRGPGSAWKLNRGAFERLLSALDDDGERAGLAYEQLRHRVAGLLQWWGAPYAEDLADETLDRVARKLEAGAVVPKASLGAYVRGVARMIFYESARRPRAVPYPADLPDAAGEPANEAPLACLDRCLDSLAPADRRLVLAYYHDGRKADVRRRLALEVGISATALRIRAHRLRARLEHCVTSCLAANGR